MMPQALYYPLRGLPYRKAVQYALTPHYSDRSSYT
jgi:hypothetical protein